MRIVASSAGAVVEEELLKHERNFEKILRKCIRRTKKGW